MIAELMNCDDQLKHYFAGQAALLLTDDFLNVLPGLVNNPESVSVIESHLKLMKTWF